MEAIGKAETKRRLGEDRQRILDFLERETGSRAHRLALHPSYQAAYLHRWSHYHFRRGRRWLARVLWHCNLLLTGADISPLCDLGGGLLLAYPLGLVLVGKAGRNLTVCGYGGMGGGLSRHDVGAGPGLPVLGDDVVLEFGALILGPVHIGDGARVGPGCLATSDVPGGGAVAGAAPALRRTTPPPAEVAAAAAAGAA